MKRTKTLVIGLLTIVLLAGLVISPGCAKPVEEEKIKIVSVFQYAGIDFFVPTRIGAEDAAKEYGVDLEWLGPPGNETLEQIKIIETVLAAGEMDGLMVQGYPDVLMPVIQRVKDAGIPVVLTNELFEHDLYDSFCGADGLAVGALIGKSLELDLLGEGVWAKAVGYEGTGEVEGKIAFLTDFPGAMNLEMRLKGARDYLSQFPGIIDLGVYDGTVDMTKSKEVVTNILTAHPDLAAIISVCAGPTAAAGMILEEMGLSGTVVVAGMDLLPMTLTLVQEEEIASLVGQNPYGQGYLPVKYLCEYLLNDKPMPRWMPTDLEVVTLDNVDFIIEREEAYLR